MRPAALLIAAALAGCGDATKGTDLQSCDLGTMDPDAPLIDPDAPVFSDASWTQEEVEAAFAAAREEDSTAYRAYRAAGAWPDHLSCAWCACGCAAADGHQSALDCFKDMHGFT